nr:F-box domain, cyclin-like protein [Tanacetum cinerariifolium]
TSKHLSLSCNDKYTSFSIQNSDWDLPSLETLYLTNLQIVNASGKIVSLFSKCVTLKDLTLSWMNLHGLDIFKICAPQLCNLRIKQPHGFPKVLNVASPQLKNLTASVRAPNKETSCFDILKLSTYDFNCLQNVNLSMSFSYEEKTHVPELLRWFQQLHNTKSLILDMNIVEYRQLRLVLSTEDKENYLEHPIPAAPVAPPGQQVPPQALAVHAAWVKGQKEVTVLMLLTMDLEIQRNLAHLGAYSMLQELKAMYSKQAE